MNPRISTLSNDASPATSRTILERTEKAIGMVPNLYRTLAHSPATLSAYTGTARELGGGTLSAKLREQLAVAVAAYNDCAYCASAHTAIGRSVGLDADELTQNLSGRSPSSSRAV